MNLPDKSVLPSLLITGANGFVGHALGAEAARRGHAVRGATRREVPLPSGVTPCVVGELVTADWTEALRDTDVVIHLAARVHVMNKTADDPLAAFMAANVDATLALARQAAAAGVRQFIYVSTIKVNGEHTLPGHPFSEADPPAPQDAYGVSKWRAEQALQILAAELGMALTILRPPLVYGAGVKANFNSLLRAVRKGVPLPLASVHNARSLLYLGNFVDAILCCCLHPEAAGQTFLVRDGEDVSMPQLMRLLARGMNVSARLFPMPIGVLRGLAALAGRRDVFERITGMLCIDDSLIRQRLGWSPPFTVDEGLQRTARAFVAMK